MINIEESFACGQLVRLFNLLQASNCKEHANRRTQRKEIHWFKVQRVVDHRHLKRRDETSFIVIAYSMTLGVLFQSLQQH